MRTLIRYVEIYLASIMVLLAGTFLYCLFSLSTDASSTDVSSSSLKSTGRSILEPSAVELSRLLELTPLPFPLLEIDPGLPSLLEATMNPVPEHWFTETPSSSGYYILINTVANRLSLTLHDRTIAVVRCSTGSEQRLTDGEREWIFKTPRGRFRILSKVANPVWRKPDWAFLEEGEPIPAHEHERFESGVLGEYALALGGPYYIHGTLYEKLLGQSVTHGCIRLGSRDLIFLAQAVPVGTPVFIY
ncbi:MAG TPA: L,D-transpeptidase [Acidobacteriota bacterium]|nr:L,D-transpeptidase [Acidobacteriota bacterium]